MFLLTVKTSEYISYLFVSHTVCQICAQIITRYTPHQIHNHKFRSTSSLCSFLQYNSPCNHTTKLQIIMKLNTHKIYNNNKDLKIVNKTYIWYTDSRSQQVHVYTMQSCMHAYMYMYSYINMHNNYVHVHELAVIVMYVYIDIHIKIIVIYIYMQTI